jgi:hypothetical protein
MALPKVRYNFKGGKKEVAEIVKDIGQSIFTSARASFESAAKVVVPSVPQMVQEITDDLSAGPLQRFSEGLKKVDTLVNKLGVNLEDYSKELAQFLKLRQEKSIQSEETVNQLRTQNIIAQVNEFGEVAILTRTQIEEQEQSLKTLNKEIKTSQKVIDDYAKIQKRGGTLNEEQQKDLIEANEKVIKKTEERAKILNVLNKTESEDTRTFREKAGDAIEKYVPDGLRDIGSAFTEGLMAPFNAIKDLGLMFGNLLKPLKLLPKLLKGFTVGLLGALAAMIPYLLIAGAVVLAIVALKKGFDLLMENIDTVKNKLSNFADAIMEIPQKISDFFTGIFTKIKNFFIDMINSVITLLNDKLGFLGVDIKKLEKEPTIAEQKQQEAVSTITEQKQQEAVSAMKSDEAYNVPETQIVTAPESKIISESKLPLNVNKKPEMLTPPVDVSNVNNATIIDNSVKSTMQNNSTTTGGLNGTRDYDLKILDQMYSNASA